MPQNQPLSTKAMQPRLSRRPLPVRGPPRGPEDFPVVGIGASAGGLDACKTLLSALPAGNGMAFILVQHLDPTHESMLVDLLTSHTSMSVLQAADGAPVERDHLYVIPPGTYLSVVAGALRLSQPHARHGARLPFDFLLQSLAEDCGTRAIGVVLSGTGADGSLGIAAIKERCGLIIAQSPDDAAFDGMPRSAIATGLVDLVLPAAKIPDALVKYDRRKALSPPGASIPQESPAHDCLPKIIELLRTKTAHDFTLYKQGTLQRRIERRMAMAAIAVDDMARYLEILQDDTAERDLLATDLLINVTSFFRDPKVFDLLAERIVPDLIRSATPDRPLRIWIAGCSTGEETYSLAMLFQEKITEANSNIKLQIFASDVDPDAVAFARESLYPRTIETDVSPDRLARFFAKEDHGYRVLPELRGAVVFTVQDVLADPPFSRLDMVSCRNLLIYLRPEAQTKVISRFNFALREGGILLLGSSETVGNAGKHFEVISKSERLYRRIGRLRPGEIDFAMSAGDGLRVPARPGQAQAPSRQTMLGDLCRRLVVEAFAPAAVLINSKNECLYSLGPTERYLRVAPGQPSHDLFAMTRRDLRTRLRSAIQRANQEKARIDAAGGQIPFDGHMVSFRIDIQPVSSEGEELLLVCFVDEPKSSQKRSASGVSRNDHHVADLEQELEVTRTELKDAISNLEISSEEQKAINEEALSVNEEYQSTNEELLTSKEELQSLNEELTALNSQLQETLELKRTTSNDLQNVLYSTDVATIFLDTRLNIRFFTPATRTLFSVIPSDLGRPLADLNPLAADNALLSDARAVLEKLTPIEREIEARDGLWYIRRILPYRTQDGGVEGVVITFVDITERKHAADALEIAKRQAELANIAKSRFLAAASHDLRQPLQTLALLQGLLAKAVVGEKAQKLVARLDETLGAISGMLNTLLDINQIEAGTVHPEMVEFPINDLLDQLGEEFAYHAQSQNLALRMIPCGLSVRSDPRLLEQMIRNLLSNALKYTEQGKILLGCRRHEGLLSIEVWDTGVGIPESELQAIFEEYHQLDNAARERSRGLGLGLSIVKRLGDLLGHPVRVRSRLRKGSVFAIEIAQPLIDTAPRQAFPPHGEDGLSEAHVCHTGTILVVEDDPELRTLLELLLKDEGHRTATAADGVAALELVQQEGIRPDLILTDYNLPKDMNGLQVAARLREKFQCKIPVVILTGDISSGTLRDIALQNCEQLNKPVKLTELTQAVQRLLPATPPHSPLVAHAPQPPAKTSGIPESPIIFVVDDDRHVRQAIREVLEEDGRTVEDFATCEAFLEAYQPGHEACLVIDAYLPGMSGLELLNRLNGEGHRLPAIMITGYSDVPTAVQAMKAGALDFIEKPIGSGDLLACVARALELSRDATKLSAWRETAANHVADLTPRQRQIMEMVLAGNPSKNIAADLGISQRTVENHRASIMAKTGSKSLPALARLALAATWNAPDEPHI
ncbi:chemotaxis protein CheB [Telmatospirillum siberiense]|uniref:histidine kinase n=1 Tax=Telmatospirillum siberiense TaxID=382514 RepID=A0A2N3PRJ1_9PROT|nr:chemotaxis protein CheB [Telmatospirillum siberiense]PKU23011.1 histidine kinase [Telmatospirillum siberiense]